MKEFFGLIPFVKIPEASIHHYCHISKKVVMLLPENVNLMELHFPFC